MSFFAPEQEDKLKEECGVFGIYNPDGSAAAPSIYYGLSALQHRGQEACGIAVCNTNGPKGNITWHKDMGLVSEVFHEESLDSLKGNIGREIGSLTVGVVGTGKIGTHVIRNLSGFGCRILAYDLYENDTVKQYASYRTLEEVFAESDILTFHTPATPGSYHMVNAESIRTMKDGVVIINTARGSIIDTPAFIEALEQGKIGAAALDVIENELGIFYGDYKYQVIGHREMSILKDLPNVLMLPHMAFYTENSLEPLPELSPDIYPVSVPPHFCQYSSLSSFHLSNAIARMVCLINSFLLSCG